MCIYSKTRAETTPSAGGTGHSQGASRLSLGSYRLPHSLRCTLFLDFSNPWTLCFYITI